MCVAGRCSDFLVPTQSGTLRRAAFSFASLPLLPSLCRALIFALGLWVSSRTIRCGRREQAAGFAELFSHSAFALCVFAHYVSVEGASTPVAKPAAMPPLFPPAIDHPAV